MRKNKKYCPYITSVIFTLIPAILVYLCKSDSCLDGLQKQNIIGSNIDIAQIKDCFLIASIILTFILLTIRLIKKQYCMYNALKQRDKLLSMNKSIFTATLSKELSEEYINLDIRIFVPKITSLSRIKSLLGIKRKKYFKIKNIDSLAEPGNTENLVFEVAPKQQGLVGNCYATKSIVYDTDLENTNATKYKLNKSQISKTADIKFVLCCPIFNGDDVVSIMSFDSKQRINMSRQQHDKLRDHIVVFSQSIYEHIPELFKPIGGII